VNWDRSHGIKSKGSAIDEVRLGSAARSSFPFFLARQKAKVDTKKETKTSKINKAKKKKQ
jgi:hypothetical protein